MCPDLNVTFILLIHQGSIFKLKTSFRLFQYVDTSVLPTKLRFNVTVSHETPASNSDAHSVVVKGGDKDQEIFWADRGSGEGPMPWDPELHVVDNVWWTWTKSILGSWVFSAFFVNGTKGRNHLIKT